MDYTETGEGILLKNAVDFEPTHIFECGQCFRWNRQQDGNYKGVAKGRVLEIKKIGQDVLFAGTGREDFEKIWMDYFDLKRDYGEIKLRLSRDPVLKEAIKYGYGIRILKQDVWETLISFIISANNNIPRIKNTIEKLCRRFGKKIEYNGNIYYDFPLPHRFVALDEQEIQECGCGYRTRYIRSAAGIVTRKEMDFHTIENLDTDSGRKSLMHFQGVGPKVADCILLFSMGKHDAFPVDVWIKRVMEHFYLKNDTSLKEIKEFASSKFGEFAGFVQQYLFYYARDMMRSSKK